jgi:hypothetical protein
MSGLREGYALPVSQTGDFAGFKLRVFSEADEEQDDSPDQRQPAKQRRNRNMFMFFCGRMDRSDIKNLFLTSIVEPLIGKHKAAKNNQNNSK